VVLSRDGAREPLQTSRGRWREYPTFHNGGVLATAGDLVFQGSIDGILRGFDAKSGILMWQFDARAPILAAPTSFSVKGRQYVAVMTGSGTANAAYSPSMAGPDLNRFISDPRSQARRLLVFAIGGKASLPPRPQTASVPDDPDYRPDPVKEQEGMIA
jgi:quinohemoprotein ethanol dehydrogenase